MMRQGPQAYRNVVAGLILPVALAGSLTSGPGEPADASNAPPPTGTNTAPEIWGNAPRVVKVGVDYFFTPQAMDPDRAFSRGAGSGIAAYHFNATATAESKRDAGGTTDRDASPVHLQAFYVVEPEASTL